jgi:aryl-alcohol dehydrogenase-like predicted oxidoreductase
METRRIGDLEVSAVGLGTNNFGRRLDERQTVDVVLAALDAGISHFDTADVYGGGDSERLLGRALRSRRDEAIIATKFGNPMGGRGGGGSPDYLGRALEASLDRLETDHVDLYWLHRPDPSTPIGDTLLAADEQRRAGLIRAFGVSNVTPRQLSDALEAADRLMVPIAAVQNEYSLLVREPEEGVLDIAERAGLAFVPYFPLASGLLTGKYRSDRPVPEGTRLSSGAGDRWLTQANLRAVDELDEFSHGRGHTLLELAFAWLLDRPSVASVIAGAMTPQQVRANAAAAERWHLTDDERARVDEIVARAPVGAR